MSEKGSTEAAATQLEDATAGPGDGIIITLDNKNLRLEELNSRFKVLIDDVNEGHKSKPETPKEDDEDDEIARLKKENEKLSNDLQYAENRMLEKDQIMAKLFSSRNIAKIEKKSKEQIAKMAQQEMSDLRINVKQHYDMVTQFHDMFEKSRDKTQKLEARVQRLRDDLALFAEKTDIILGKKMLLEEEIATYEKLLLEQEQRIKRKLVNPTDDIETGEKVGEKKDDTVKSA